MPIRTISIASIFVFALTAGEALAQTAMPMDHAAHHAAMAAQSPP